MIKRAQWHHFWPVGLLVQESKRVLRTAHQLLKAFIEGKSFGVVTANVEAFHWRVFRRVSCANVPRVASLPFGRCPSSVLERTRLPGIHPQPVVGRRDHQAIQRPRPQCGVRQQTPCKYVSPPIHSSFFRYSSYKILYLTGLF